MQAVKWALLFLLFLLFPTFLLAPYFSPTFLEIALLALLFCKSQQCWFDKFSSIMHFNEFSVNISNSHVIVFCRTVVFLLELVWGRLRECLMVVLPGDKHLVLPRPSSSTVSPHFVYAYYMFYIVILSKASVQCKLK